VKGRLADAAFQEWRSEAHSSPFVEKAHCDDPDAKLQLFDYLLPSWSRVLLEKQTSFQLVKKFPAF